MAGGEEGEDDDGDELFQKAGGVPRQAAGRGSKRCADQDGDDDEDEEVAGGEQQGAGGERVLGLSKKDAVTRRRELLASAPGKEACLGAAIAAVTAETAGALLRQPLACDLVVEVCRGGDGGLLCELAPDGVAAVHAAVIADASGMQPSDSAAGGGDGEDAVQGSGVAAEHLFEQYYAGRALRRLILSSGEQGAAAGGAVQFSEQLWRQVVAGRCKRWLGGHGEKVLGALLHCGSVEVRGAVAKELAPLVKPQTVEAWGARFTATNGAACGGKTAGKGGTQAGPKSPAAGKVQAAVPAAAIPAAANGKAAVSGSKRGRPNAAGSAALITAAPTPKSAKRSKAAAK